MKTSEEIYDFPIGGAGVFSKNTLCSREEEGRRSRQYRLSSLPCRVCCLLRSDHRPKQQVCFVEEKKAAVARKTRGTDHWRLPSCRHFLSPHTLPCACVFASTIRQKLARERELNNNPHGWSETRKTSARWP